MVEGMREVEVEVRVRDGKGSLREGGDVDWGVLFGS